MCVCVYIYTHTIFLWKVTFVSSCVEVDRCVVTKKNYQHPVAYTSVKTWLLL